MSRIRFNKDGSFIATNGYEDNEQQSPPPPNTTTNTMMLNNNVINNKTIFQNIDTTIPKQDSNFYKDNDNEKVILNNLHDRIKKLERLKDEWENLVIEGDILEKSYMNIGNSGDSKLYSLFPAVFECKEIFRIKYKDNLDKMEACIGEIAEHHIQLKDRICVIEGVITELQKINHPVTDVINTKKDVLKILYAISQHVDTIFSKSSIDNNNNKNGNRIR